MRFMLEMSTPHPGFLVSADSKRVRGAFSVSADYKGVSRPSRLSVNKRPSEARGKRGKRGQAKEGEKSRSLTLFGMTRVGAEGAWARRRRGGVWRAEHRKR